MISATGSKEKNHMAERPIEGTFDPAGEIVLSS
jgi:hypothetical protein